MSGDAGLELLDPDLEKYRLDAEYSEECTIQRNSDANGNKTLQKWEKARSLGQGTFGHVRQERLKDDYGDWQYRAVKVCLMDPLNRSRLDYKRELSALAALSSSKHSGLFVNFIGWWIDSKHLYIAMEYFRRGDLSNYVGGNLNEQDTKEIMDDTLNALRVMHKAGFTHRDIKPQNILVVQKRPEFQKWWVKIADFGISKRILEDSSSALQTSLGTRPYCAPEVLGYLSQSQHASVYSNKVDMWSLGCVLFNISSGGYRPFSEPELVRYCDGTGAFNPRKRPLSLGSIGIFLLKTLLDPLPENRPSAVEALKHPWLTPIVESISQRIVESKQDPASSVDSKLDPVPPNQPENYNSFLQETQDPRLSRTFGRFKNSLNRMLPRFTQSELPHHNMSESSVTMVASNSPQQPESANSESRNEDLKRVSDTTVRDLRSRVPGKVAQPNPNGFEEMKDKAGSKTAIHDMNPESPGIWSLTQREDSRRVTGHTGFVSIIAFSVDGLQLASGSDDKSIGLWNAYSGEMRLILTGHSDWVRAVAFSPDGELLVSGSDDKSVIIWDTRTGQSMRTIPAAHTGWIRAVAFSPDGITIASGSNDHLVKLWDASTGSLLHTLNYHKDIVKTVAFSADGNLIASGDEDDLIKLCNVATGEWRRTLLGHEAYVRAIAFSPNGLWLVSASEDKTAKIWKLQVGMVHHTLAGHTKVVRKAAFSPDSSLVVTGSSDNTVKLWDVATGNLLHTFNRHYRSVRGVAFSPDGKVIASAGSDEQVFTYYLDDYPELSLQRGNTVS